MQRLGVRDQSSEHRLQKFQKFVFLNIKLGFFSSKSFTFKVYDFFLGVFTAHSIANLLKKVRKTSVHDCQGSCKVFQMGGSLGYQKS